MRPHSNNQGTVNSDPEQENQDNTTKKMTEIDRSLSPVEPEHQDVDKKDEYGSEALEQQAEGLGSSTESDIPNSSKNENDLVVENDKACETVDFELKKAEEKQQIDVAVSSLITEESESSSNNDEDQFVDDSTSASPLVNPETTSQPITLKDSPAELQEHLIVHVPSEHNSGNDSTALAQDKEAPLSVDTLSKDSVAEITEEIENLLNELGDDVTDEALASQLLEAVKDEPVFILTSLAGGGIHMPRRTNRLATILTANEIKFTYRDCGTDDEARQIWRTFSRGRLLPGIVRGTTLVGNWQEVDEANEEYRLYEFIYETL